MILSIDPGTKNLSLCVMDSNQKIQLWQVHNVLDAENVCSGIKKSGDICGKKSGWKCSEGFFFCKTHSPKKVTKVKKNKVANYTLQDIATRTLEKINTVHSENTTLFDKIHTVLIELQPNCNRRMMFISHIIYSRLLSLLPGIKLSFIRASQKLKAYTGPKIECKLKSKYSQRKYLSIQYAKFFLKDDPENLKLLEDSSKADDLSDCFLMCINGTKKKTYSKTSKTPEIEFLD
jgi:hypothetical protein